MFSVLRTQVSQLQALMPKAQALFVPSPLDRGLGPLLFSARASAHPTPRGLRLQPQLGICDRVLPEPLCALGPCGTSWARVPDAPAALFTEAALPRALLPGCLQCGREGSSFRGPSLLCAVHPRASPWQDLPPPTEAFSRVCSPPRTAQQPPLEAAWFPGRQAVRWSTRLRHPRCRAASLDKVPPSPAREGLGTAGPSLLPQVQRVSHQETQHLMEPLPRN